nr:hypothetical protein [Microbacterium mitrae]
MLRTVPDVRLLERIKYCGTTFLEWHALRDEGDFHVLCYGARLKSIGVLKYKAEPLRP